MTNKVLIIRFSSFGDIVQNMSCLKPLKNDLKAEIHWLTKSEFSNVLTMSEDIDSIISFDKKIGMLGLIKLAISLRAQNYTHIYDAHSNIRSLVVSIILKFFRNIQFAKRSKDRLKRVLLFSFKKNLFDWPFLGAVSYLKPIRSWIKFKSDKTDFQLNSTFNDQVREHCDNLIANIKEDFIAIAPSAAWQMKRWPIENWKRLVSLNNDKKFVVLGGPDDHFCQEIADIDPSRILNLAGSTSLIQSCYISSVASLVISADTGILHVADLLGVKTLALIGPTAFGFPSSPTTKTISVELDCRPCTKDGRGKCSADTYQKCMVDLTPELVSNEVRQALA